MSVSFILCRMHVSTNTQTYRNQTLVWMYLAAASCCASSALSTRSVTVSEKTRRVPTADSTPSTVFFSQRPSPSVALVATTRSPTLHKRAPKIRERTHVKHRQCTYVRTVTPTKHTRNTMHVAAGQIIPREEGQKQSRQSQKGDVHDDGVGPPKTRMTRLRIHKRRQSWAALNKKKKKKRNARQTA